MIPWLRTGLDEALAMTLEAVVPLAGETVPLDEALGRVVFKNMASSVDSPSMDASLKDGFAVVSADLTEAAPERPVTLKLLQGQAAAGLAGDHIVTRGQALRILTGARLPAGADAVLPEEFADVEGFQITAVKDVTPGRNVLPRGSDVARGEVVAEKGDVLTPGRAGIIAASGWSEVPAFRRPRVAIVATGDEVVAPGQPLPEGKLYASNMVMLGAFCREWGMLPQFYTAADDRQAIRDCLDDGLLACDALITSGGAWTGDRDLVADILSEMGWQKRFHRIRIGPGKAVGFGTLGQVPVFILPGGPPSNLMGFLQIAFPGLRRLAGACHTGLPERRAMLSETLYGRERHWTQFVYGQLEPGDPCPTFVPLHRRGRLQSMALSTAVATIPEGVSCLDKGQMTRVQVLPGAMSCP